jgi:hypothetical protein
MSAKGFTGFIERANRLMLASRQNCRSLRKPNGSPRGQIQSKEETMGDLEHGVRFPGESESYRKARNELLRLL